MNINKALSAQFLTILCFVIVILLFPSINYAAAGDVETGFRAAAELLPAGTVYETILQPDGKILIAGNFRSVGGVGRSGIARLNADGTLDNSFNPVEIRSSDNRGNATIYAIARQSDGKLLVGGSFAYAGGLSRTGIVRLNPDGSFDNSFDLTQSFTGIAAVYDIKIQTDGRILVGGSFRYLNSYVNLMRLQANGNLDGTFFSGNGGNVVEVNDMIIQPDGKIIYVGGRSSPLLPRFKRINPDGNEDTSFTANTFGGGGVFRIARQTDGKLVIGGDFSNVNGFSQVRYLARFSADGTFDTGFNTNNSGPSGPVFAVDFLSNSKIVIGGAFTEYNSGARNSVALLNADGTLDNSFVYPDFRAPVYDLDVVANDNILVGGAASNGFGVPLNGSLLKVNPSGLADPAFNPNVGKNGTVYRTKIQPDGKILVVGNISHANGLPRRVIARFNPDGTSDTSFNSTVFTALPTNDYGPIDLQPDGKIIVGNFRLNPDGSLDTTFQNVFGIRDVKVLPDGKILFATLDSLKRFNADGTPDSQFVANTNSLIYKIVLLPGGKILIGGRFTQVNGVNRGYFARLNSDGTVDATFNPPGGANEFVYNIDVQSDGKILIGGGFTAVNFDATRKYVARLNPDGSLDTSFNASTNNNVYGLKVQSDGKILIGGVLTAISGVPRNFFGRLNADGSIDQTFGAGTGANDWVWEFNQQADGKILIGGAFSQINGKSAVGLARLVNVNTPFDFDGDGRSDVSVFRSSTNRWYEFLSSNSSVFETTFGISGDIVAPADFDGDGKTDIAVFRPASGDWWYLSSVSGGQVNVRFGASGDIPRPADFDGDGRADFIVFRPSNSVWYRLGSTGAVSVAAFGTSGDKPLVGDFDGDGKADLAVYRPSTGTWWYQSSLDNSQRATAFGISTDIPVPADYDGDGKTDPAVYRPSTGVWYILNSSTNGATIVGFGLSEDKPVAADYDGDGRADIAVFRPSTGVWYLLRSTAGFAALQFGISTDTPVPNAFVQ